MRSTLCFMALASATAWADPITPGQVCCLNSLGQYYYADSNCAEGEPSFTDEPTPCSSVCCCVDTDCGFHPSWECTGNATDCNLSFCQAPNEAGRLSFFTKLGSSCSQSQNETDVDVSLCGESCSDDGTGLLAYRTWGEITTYQLTQLPISSCESPVLPLPTSQEY